MKRRAGGVVATIVAAAGLLAQPEALAQTGAYPVKALRLIVPFQAGGAADVVGRMTAQKLAEGLGQNVVVENRGGGGTVIGTEIVARAAADGYTLLLNTPSFTINAGLIKPPYDSLRDFAPVSLIGSTPLMMVSHPSLPVRSVKELIALARARPGDIIFGSSGTGSPTHLAIELLRSAGARMTHVPYKGGAPAVTDLLGGHVQVVITSIILVQEHAKRGRLRALGVTTLKRSPALPDVPAIAETVPGYEVLNWWGLVAPAGTPPDVVRRLQAEVARGVQAPDMRQRLTAEGADPIGSEPERFGAMLAREIEMWTRVIRETGVRAN
jgi:tripartite-type tricarboxylate transporter receptor subunit TctC